MPYVQRDEQGGILALFAVPTEQAVEELPVGHPEVAAFLRAAPSGQSAAELLAETDRELSRILEDLVELLVVKQVIRFTDLPVSAQEKLLSRRRARERLQGSGHSMLDPSDLL